MKKSSDLHEEESPKFRLTVDEKQLRVILDALDMYSRMGMGQLDVAVEEFLRTYFMDIYYDELVDSSSDRTRGMAVKDHVDAVKNLVFGHASNGSWSIYNRQVPRVCREAYDLQQVFRKTLALRRLQRAREAGEEEAAAHIRMTVDMGFYHPANPEWLPAHAEDLSEPEPPKTTSLDGPTRLVCTLGRLGFDTSNPRWLQGASYGDLLRLPGIGRTYADKLVAWAKEHRIIVDPSYERQRLVSGATSWRMENRS